MGYLEDFFAKWGPVNKPRVEIFKELLKRFEGTKAIDLGAGHGVFGRIAADEGWSVVAIDARTDLWGAVDPRITWVQQDVRETDVSGYDLILNLGLFYHLTYQDQRNLLAKCAPTPMILETHFSTSGTVEVDGLRGHFYGDTGSGGDLLGSWGNATSFWPTLESLEQMLYVAGYPRVDVRPPFAGDRTFIVCGNSS